ncbi:hypothetical protein KAS41_04525 [Candidatus Parcubacteria bacterium]|nr:hypothetical protein [Candidatus Parcubacteria bacterium]
MGITSSNLDDIKKIIGRKKELISKGLTKQEAIDFSQLELIINNAGGYDDALDKEGKKYFNDLKKKISSKQPVQ